MKKFIVSLLAAAMVFSIIFAGCAPGAAPVTPPAAPVTPPPESVTPPAQPVTPPAEPVTPPVEQEKRLVFAYILFGNLSHPFLAETYQGFKAACDLFGVDCVLSCAEYDETKMIDLVDAAVAQDVDGIMTFSWQDPHSLTPSFQRALDKGINVVHMSSHNPDFTAAQVPFIGFNVYDQGYTLGTDWANRLTAEGRVTDVNIGTFLTKTDSPLELDRRQGFLDALADGGIEYTSSDPTPTDPTQAVAMDQIKAYLLAHPETDLIMGTGGTPTAACFQAVDALGYEPGKVWVAGFDLLPEAVVGVRAGYGACNQDEVFPYGFLGATALYLRITHPPLVIKDLPIATVMIDKTNVDVYFPE
jgi:simple sugar transport system substrate-binding protein